ncbi:MAG: hypothetical protein ABR543_05680 [Gemmatimonadaceae bacterium]
MPKRQSVIADMIDGAIAGAIATWAMGKVTTAIYQHEDKAARQREDEARDGKTAYGVAAEKAAALYGRELSDDDRKQYGQAIHWALGAGAGALYGVLRPRSEGASLAGGLLFGAAFWLVMDEVVTPARSHQGARGVPLADACERVDGSPRVRRRRQHHARRDPAECLTATSSHSPDRPGPRYLAASSFTRAARDPWAQTGNGIPRRSSSTASSSGTWIPSSASRGMGSTR